MKTQRTEKAAFATGAATLAAWCALATLLSLQSSAVGAQDLAAPTATIPGGAPLAGIEERHAALEREAGELAERVLVLEKSNQELTASNKELQQKLLLINAAGKNFSRNLARRTHRNVSRHVSSMAGAAIPHVGTGVLVAMATQDVKDGCETLQELNDMLRAMNLEIVDASRVCAIKVPGKDEVLAQLVRNWRTAYAVAAAVANQNETRLPVEPPIVPHAGASELWGAVFGVSPAAAPQAQPSATTMPRPPTPPTPPTPPAFRRP